jgi:hypothetical protein
MEKKYIIEDLQLKEYSIFTTLEEIFDACFTDFMANNWSDEEIIEIEHEFSAMTDEDKMQWVSEAYEYRFHQPCPLFISRWEEQHGRKFN